MGFLLNACRPERSGGRCWLKNINSSTYLLSSLLRSARNDKSWLNE